MLNNLKICFEILLYRKLPQDLPYQPSAIFYLLILFTLVLSGLSAVLETSEQNVILVVAIIFACGLSYCALLLATVGKLPRLIQASNALLGTELILNVFTIGYVLLILPLGSGPLVIMTSLILYIWRLAVFCRIFKEMLSTKSAIAIGLTIAFEFIRVAVLLTVTTPMEV